MKIKTIPKMLAVLMVCLAVIMSISTSVFAVDDNANDTGEHEAGYTSLPGYDNTEYGYRISVVDGNTGEVIGSFDLGNLPGADTYYTGTGTDPSTNGNQGDFNVGHMDMPAGMPPPLNWTGSSFTSNGDAVNAWLMSDNGKGVQNIVDLVLQKYPDQADAIMAGLNSGSIKVANEPMANLPVYTNLPAGTVVDGKTVVSVTDEKGRTWNYFVNADGSTYRVNGTIRDYIMNELRPNGGGSTGSFMGPVIKGLVEAFFLDHVDTDINIDTMSAEELESLIDWILLNADLSKLGVGMHLYDMSEGGIPEPPPPPDEPPSGEENIHITESRITRRKNLANSPLSSNETLSAHAFKWEIEAFSEEIQNCKSGSCHHSTKSITDKTNTINVEQSRRVKGKDREQFSCIEYNK